MAMKPFGKEFRHWLVEARLCSPREDSDDLLTLLNSSFVDLGRARIAG